MTLLIYNVPESIDKVRTAIAAEVSGSLLWMPWPLFGNWKHFHGHVWENGFCLSRINCYRNSFRPVAYGRIESVNEGTKIVVELYPCLMTRFFTWFWYRWWTSLGSGFLLFAPWKAKPAIVGLSGGMLLVFWFLSRLFTKWGERDHEMAFDSMFQVKHQRIN